MLSNMFKTYIEIENNLKLLIFIIFFQKINLRIYTNHKNLILINSKILILNCIKLLLYIQIFRNIIYFTYFT